MLQTLGAELTSVATRSVEITAPIQENALQQHGFGHAGLTFSIGDSAAGYSALTMLPEDREVLTTEMKIHLLSPATGEKLVARGRVIRPGRSLFVVASDVFAIQGGQEKHIALMTGTMVPAPIHTPQKGTG